jgi:hypothetical protein
MVSLPNQPLPYKPFNLVATKNGKMRKSLIMSAALPIPTYVIFAVAVGLNPFVIGYQYRRKYTPPACYYKKHALQDTDKILLRKREICLFL